MDLYPLNLYPVVIIQDRYHGVYAGGLWIAIAEAEGDDDSRERVDLVWAGALDTDIPAMTFWKDHQHSPWIAVGDTPDQALKNLVDRQAIGLFDVVRLKYDLPDKSAKKGTEGAVLDVYTDPPGYEVEFPGSEYPSMGVEPQYLELVWKHVSPETKA